MKPWLRWTVGIMLGLALLVAGLWQVENRRGRQIWEETCARLRAAGEPVDFIDLIPPPVPDDENVATAPIFSELFVRGESARLAIMGDIFEKVRPRVTTPSWSGPMLVPRLKALRLDDMSTVVAWRDYMRACFPANVPKAEMAPADEILHILSPWDDELREAQEALDRPRCRWPLRYDDRGGSSPPLGMAEYGLAWIFRPRVVALAAYGDTDNCVRAVNSQLRMGRAMAGTFGAWELSTAMTNDIQALQSLQNLIPTLSLEDRHLQAMQQSLGAVSISETKQAFRNDGVYWTDFVHRLTMEQIDFRFEIMSMYQLRTTSPFDHWHPQVRNLAHDAYPFLMSSRPQGWKSMDAATYADFVRDHVLTCVDEVSDTIQPSRVAAVRAAEKKLVRSDRFLSIAMLELQAFTPALMVKAAHHHALMRGALLWCAIERFRIRNSRLPEKLEELVPEFVDKVPCDPVDGLPLRYVRKGERDYLLYSIGWNGTDDGGVETKRREEGDWVWASDPRLIVNLDEEREKAEEKAAEEKVARWKMEREKREAEYKARKEAEARAKAGDKERGAQE